MKAIAKHLTALAVLFSSATAFGQVYTCGDNNGWDISNSIVFTHENGEYTYSIDCNGAPITIYISSNINTDWATYCSGCIVPVGFTSDLVFTPEAQKVPIQKFGGNQCDIHYKFYIPGSYTIRINEEMSELTWDYTAPAEALAMNMFVAGDMNSWSMNDASKLTEAQVDGKYVLSGVLNNVKWGQSFKLADSDWKKRIALNGEIAGFGTYTFDYVPDNTDFNAKFVQGIDQVKFTAVLGIQNVQVTFEPVETAINGNIYATGEPFGKWEPQGNSTFAETDGIYSYEFTKHGIFKLSTKEGDWDEFTMGLIVPEEGAPGLLDPNAEPFAVKLHHYTSDPGNYSLPTYPGVYKVSVDKVNMKMWAEFEHDTNLQFHLQGDFNNWEGPLMTTKVEDGAYVMSGTYDALSTKEESGNTLKIATSNWSHIYCCADPINDFGTYTFTYQPNDGQGAVLAKDLGKTEVTAVLHKDTPNQMLVTFKDAEASGPTTGAGEVSDSDLPVEYYTLTGVKVSRENLTPGIYISCQGELTKKVIIK